jgi:RNA polymerase sigma-70 factor (ECF subfamily)
MESFMSTIHADKDRLANAAMARYVQGDVGGFDALCRVMSPRLRPFFAKRVRDIDDADDLVQDTLLRAYSARERFLPGADVVPWIFTIARRLLIDGSRRATRRERSLDAERANARADDGSGDRPDRLAESRELADRLTSAFEQLPETHRAAFELVRSNGLSASEAAARLGTTANAVKLRTVRVTAALREELAAA